MTGEIDELNEKLDAALAEIKAQQDIARRLEDDLESEKEARAATDAQNDLLKNEIAESKEGGLVICTFEPAPADTSALRGTSIPIGTVYLETDGITLLE